MINLLFLISKLPHLSDTLKALNRVNGHISYSTDWRKQLSDPLKKEWSHITSGEFLVDLHFLERLQTVYEKSATIKQIVNNMNGFLL